MSLRRYNVKFSGRVQGVGFRFTAVHLSRRFSGLTGYVRNLDDGRVEIAAECNAETFDGFMGAIQKSGLGRSISEVKYESEPIEKRNYKLFDIYA